MWGQTQLSHHPRPLILRMPPHYGFTLHYIFIHVCMYRIRVYLHSLLPFEVPVTSLVGQLQTAENCRSVYAFPYTKNHEKRGMKVETTEVPSRLLKGLGRGSDSGVWDLPRSKRPCSWRGTFHEVEGRAPDFALKSSQNTLKIITVLSCVPA